MIFEKTKNSCLFQGDSREILADNFSDNSIDSFVCDPPYGLKFMGKDWDHGIPGVPYWAEMLRVAQPGAYLLAFGGTRKSHRLACAIEDAGWEIRDTMMWVYGSGFPKSHDISKAIDKMAGAEREIIGKASHLHAGKAYKVDKGWNSNNLANCEDVVLTTPATPEAKRWNGWGTALKPAWEPIIMARKPLIGTVAENVLRYGTGGLNIDGCRVGTEVIPEQKRGDAVNTNFKSGGATPEHAGRWPANLIWSHSPNCKEEECSEDCPSRGFPTSSITGNRKIKDRIQEESVSTPFTRGQNAPEYTDSGSASRFFYCAKVHNTERDRGVEDFYWRKTGKTFVHISVEEYESLKNECRAKGNVHPTVKPISLCQYLCRLVTPPGGVVVDPFMGSGSIGLGAKKYLFPLSKKDGMNQGVL